MRDHFLRLVRYHRWATLLVAEEVLATAVGLPAQSYATLEHLANADAIWWSRLAGAPAPSLSAKHAPPELNALLRQSCERLIDLVQSPTFDYRAMCRYTKVGGQSFAEPVGDILTHVVNHGTHHRGQLVAQLRAAGVAPPETDYIKWVREVNLAG